MSEPRLSRRHPQLETSTSKNESILRSKIRLLEEQVTRLQSSMNLFVNIEEKSRQLPVNHAKSCGHEQQIRSMSAKLVTLEQDRQRLTRKVNGLEVELEEMKEKQRSACERIHQLEEDNKELSIQLNQNSLRIRQLELQERYLQEQKQRLDEQLKRLQQKHNNYVQQVQLVEHHILIRISHKEKLTLLKLSDYEGLKNDLFSLKLKMSELEGRERWDKEQQQFKHRKSKFELNRECPDIAHEIVRLKRNIDLGLGSPDSQVAGSFLTKFNEVRKALDSLST